MRHPESTLPGHRHGATAAGLAFLFAAAIVVPATGRAQDADAASAAPLRADAAGDDRRPRETGVARPAVVMPSELSLRDALALAVEHSPVIEQARERIRLEEGVRVEARADRFPEVDVESQFDVTDGERIESFGGVFQPLDESWRADLVVRFTVFAGGRKVERWRAADAGVVAARQQLSAAINDVLHEVALRYFDALLAREGIQVREQALDVLEEQLTNARNRFKAGTGAQFDVLQAEVALANARPPLVRSRARLRAAVDALRRTMGMAFAPEAGADAAAAIRLSTDWPNPPPAGDLDSSLRTALANRPELAALEAELDAGRARLRAAEAERLPTIDLLAGYGAESKSFSDDLTDPLTGWTAGIRFSLPVFDFGRIRGRVDQAASRLRLTALDVEQERLDIEGEVRDAWLLLGEASEILETSQLVVGQAREALRLARASFDAGTVTQLDVLQSQLQLTEARLEEVVALHTYHSALASLRRAIGIPIRTGEEAGASDVP